MNTMVSSSPAPSPSPTPPLGSVPSPSHHHSLQNVSTKAGALLASAKATLAEQSARIALKHNTDLDLLDDLRVYLKNRCSIEQHYAQALIKLNQTYSKKTSPLLSYLSSEDEMSDVKTVYTSWRLYQEEMEKHAKARLTQFEQLSGVCEQLKLMRNHKVQVTKKCLDTHLKKMQEEIVNSVAEIDKTRKMYFEEEHLAKQARDKEEKIKKRKTGIFSSFASLQNRKERTSAHREASDIQSTQARNEYLLALAAGNAHLTHYHEQDLVNLMLTIDDCSLDKCRGFILTMLQAERDLITSWSDVTERTSSLLNATSADYTNSVFLRDPNSAAINETLLFEFQPCDNDPLDTVSLEHNADIALRNEGQKWFQWFSKECRNLNRLSAQLIKLQTLQSEGHKTVEVAGSGSVDLENRIDEIRQQLRKSEISKMKAKARLQLIRDSGAEVEDYEAFEVQVANEIKQKSLDVDLTIGALSRTSSVRSNIGFSENKSPTFNKSESENASSSHHRPESSSSVEQLDSPDREVLQMGSSMECTSPAPTGFVNTAEVSSSWEASAYDPAQAWDDEPAQSSAYNGHDQAAIDSSGALDASTADQGAISGQEEGAGDEHEVHHGDYEHHYDEYHHELTVDAFTLVGKQCYALYAYEGQTEDDLSFGEQEIVTVLDATDKDWVRAEDSNGQIGYVPAAYLQLMPDQEGADQEANSGFDQQAQNYPTTDYEPDTQIEVTVVEDVHYISEPYPTTEATKPEPSTDHEASSGGQFAEAIYDYVATSAEEISFKAGEMIQILENFSDDGWWTGRNEAGNVGHFPSMLVHAPDHDADDDEEDEEEDSEEEEDEDDNDGDDDNENSAVFPSFAPPPPVPAPSALPGQVSEESFPPPPPLPSSDGDTNTTTTTTTTTTIPTQSNEVNGVGGAASDVTGGVGATSLPPTFAPPPKPMTLMAPQMVVIIQPTPEIENRPIVEEMLENSINNTNTNNGEGNAGNGEGECGMSVALAIAAHEIATDITQQAIDDSMAEISRRASLEPTPEEATTISPSSDAQPVAQPEVEITPADTVEQTPTQQESGQEVEAKVDVEIVVEDEEDCK